MSEPVRVAKLGQWAAAHEPGPGVVDLDESGQRRPVWSQLDHLVDGARARGFSEAQCEYLTSCIGITWAKATFHAERSR